VQSIVRKKIMERDYFGEIGADGRIIFKLILKTE
jgi:hypothetical protein